MRLILEILFWASVIGVVYHHAVYPLLLRALAARRPPPSDPAPLPDAVLPPITLVIPAYQEAGFIAGKLEDCGPPRLSAPSADRNRRLRRVHRRDRRCRPCRARIAVLRRLAG